MRLLLATLLLDVVFGGKIRCCIVCFSNTYFSNTSSCGLPHYRNSRDEFKIRINDDGDPAHYSKPSRPTWQAASWQPAAKPARAPAAMGTKYTDLKDKCVKKRIGEYDYEICHFKTISQVLLHPPANVDVCCL